MLKILPDRFPKGRLPSTFQKKELGRLKRGGLGNRKNMRKTFLIIIIILQVSIVGLLGWLLKEKKCDAYTPYTHYHFHECPETKMMDQIITILPEGDEAIINGKAYRMTPMGTLLKIRDCGCDCLNQ